MARAASRAAKTAMHSTALGGEGAAAIRGELADLSPGVRHVVSARGAAEDDGGSVIRRVIDGAASILGGLLDEKREEKPRIEPYLGNRPGRS